MLFAREAAWQVLEPILDTATPPDVYEPRTWGRPEADRLAPDIGGGHDPGAEG